MQTIYNKLPTEPLIWYVDTNNNNNNNKEERKTTEQEVVINIPRQDAKESSSL